LNEYENDTAKVKNLKITEMTLAIWII